MLTILLTSARVAPGLLSWEAWEALRGASRVFVRSGHPQLAALADAGVVAPEIVAIDDSDVAALAQLLVDATTSKGAGPVAWLPTAGSVAAELLAVLSEARVPGGVRVMRGSHDLPGAHLIDLVATMDTLRVNCPWDRQQTHASLAPHLLEEPYEALEALENGDHQALREELGDVLLQVMFHARIAAERPAEDDGYTIDDVADTIVAKLVRRHPHVFADVAVGSAQDVIRNWDEIKKAERAAKQATGADGVAAADAPPSVLDGVVFGQPALSLAAQVLRRAARAGVPASLLDDLPGLGEELLRVAARATAAGLDPELELRAAVRRLAALVRDWELTRS